MPAPRAIWAAFDPETGFPVTHMQFYALEMLFQLIVAKFCVPRIDIGELWHASDCNKNVMEWFRQKRS